MSPADDTPARLRVGPGFPRHRDEGRTMTMLTLTRGMVDAAVEGDSEALLGFARAVVKIAECGDVGECFDWLIEGDIVREPIQIEQVAAEWKTYCDA
jgi:hypothetical protein